MLPKKKRITKELFQDIMKNGRTISSPLFTFRYSKSASPKYAFVVPKNIAKSSVVRVKLRRKGYNILRLMPSLPVFTGIFFYKKEAQKSSLSELALDLANTLNKIKP